MCLKIVRDLSFAAVSANCLIQTKWHKSKTTIENRIQKAYFSIQHTTYNNNRKACNIEPSQIQWMNEWTNGQANKRTIEPMNDSKTTKQRSQKSNESRTKHYVNNFQIKINAHWKRNHSVNCSANLTGRARETNTK